MSAAEPGDLVAGRYRLMSVLGRGGMGVVWLAADELLHREVAIKEIQWPSQLDARERETLRQRALREARTAARLNHPNVIGVYDVVVDDERPWIVMQLARYRSLSDAVRDEGPLAPVRAARVGLQILAAIRAAHAAGVLHRDVKPGNVLLGPDDQVLLTDFGMAIADGSPTLTTTGVLIGSPSYMAPERARGERSTPATDLWSLGATLYAAVEGRPPFAREGTMAVLAAVVSADPDPPRRAGALWPVISGLLRKDPTARLNAAEAERMLLQTTGGGAVSSSALAEPTSPMRATVPVASSQATGHRPLPAPEDRPQWQTAVSSARRRPIPVAGLPYEPDVPARPSLPPLCGSDDEPGLHGPARKWWLLAVAAGLALIAATAATVSLTAGNAPGRGTASSGSRAPVPAHRAAPSPVRHKSHEHHSPTPRSIAPANPGSHPGALPVGLLWYHDPTGFSIGMPIGWHVSHQGHLVYIQDPTGTRFLIIDQTTRPKPNPLADWRQQEAARISTYPGYHRIRLQAVQYPQAQRAADWQFTYEQSGQLTEVLNRNILVNSHQAYALYWSTPATQWSASYHFFTAFAATFRPAGFVRGS
jgi:eukaryotic-like serine/threonine-protein kinase